MVRAKIHRKRERERERERGGEENNGKSERE